VTDTLRVRFYNVRFGDGILVTVPDRDPQTNAVTTRHILIDVGNAPLVASPQGGDDSVFKPVFDDIVTELGGRPVDLYVMTHEHLDHVQGLPHAAWKTYPGPQFAAKLTVDYAWLTASAHPSYYDTHPAAKKELLAHRAMLARIERYLLALGEEARAPFLRFLAINNPASTTECVAFLRKLAPEAKTHYVHRSVGNPAGGAPLFDPAGKHPFKETQFEIWAPEEDTSEYYGRFQPLWLGDDDGAPGAVPAAADPVPPAGVDAGAFYNMVEARRRGLSDNLLAIDKAANNTSVVLLLKWRGWRLLFAGDAETRSWRTMDREGVLGPVHFLKVSHHGSHNGTPEGGVFDAILPSQAPDQRGRRAAISTWTETYAGIPHPPTNARLTSRCTLQTTLDDTQALFFDLAFPG
jgi:hypothetical protein